MSGFKTNIFVIGYFGHANTGDEQYLYTFNYVFNNYLPSFGDYNIDYIDCDQIKNKQFSNSDIIILGGGDILNNYFLDKIIAKFSNKPNKIIAVSVGVPYINIIHHTNKLHIIDYIFCRTQQDIQLLKQYYHPNRIGLLPDISYFLQKIKKNTDGIDFIIINNKLKKAIADNKKIIAITLSRHIYDKNDSIGYHKILVGLSKFIKYLLVSNYYIVLLPFNTNKNNLDENDTVIHNDLLELLDNSYSNSILNITDTLTPSQILNLYQYFHITVPMRFHSVLFSVYSKVPILPIFTTRKIKNLLLDIDWFHGYQLPCNQNDKPTELNSTLLINRFKSVSNLHNLLKIKLSRINRDFFQTNMHSLTQFISLFTSNYPKLSVDVNIDGNNITTRVLKIYEIVQNISSKYGFSDFRNISDEKHKKFITQIVSYYLTDGTTDSIYNYGLYSKMFSPGYNYKDEWSWVLTNHKKTKVYNNPNGIFNISYIDQNDYSDAHRSGWQFVYQNLLNLNNNRSNILLDLYVDRTFHWNYSVNKELGIIPYTKKWVGFVHHTFETEFSEFNNHNLLTNPEFLQSLKYCNGIFVLSRYLQIEFTRYFQNLNINVPVVQFTHPTEINVPRFCFQKFIENKDKKLIHIGGWLRNIFSFYNLNLTNVTLNIKKAAIKGSYMNNYFPPNNFLEGLYKFLALPGFFNIDNITNASPNCSNNNVTSITPNCSSNATITNNELQNNWSKHFYKYVQTLFKDIELIEKLSNQEYDHILTNNIVFLNLVDASAVNTVIECIIRHTPIIINKHPAIIELLGENYPLYYDNNYELNTQITQLLSNVNKIKKAHVYLVNLDKTKFHIEFFKNQLINTLAK